MKIQTSIMTFEEASKKHPRKNFLTPSGYCFEESENILIVYCEKIIAGWFLFSIEKNNKRNFKNHVVYQTSTWVSPKMRKKSIAKKMNISLVKIFDNKFGSGKYIFKSIICSLGGAKIWNHRISLTSNPQSHIFYDELGCKLWDRENKGFYKFHNSNVNNKSPH